MLGPSAVWGSVNVIESPKMRRIGLADDVAHFGADHFRFEKIGDGIRPVKNGDCHRTVLIDEFL